ncbi:MBL fold metallo-hydrolase RNA specificity domain-containing protein [Marinobacter salarius]|uniref:MBL fold metallo-hydrolase RNA specificity domain-containing protein n=1 Tax=Marinobacter salarius TaxID=1420917 RepID=UPI003D9C0488
MIDENTEFVRTVEESIELNSVRLPCIIISASGMASGDRVLHHLKTLRPNPRNSLVLAGSQALVTRRDTSVNGAESMKIYGEYWPVKAEVYNPDSLSAHGDYKEISQCLGAGTLKPEKVYVTHGETLKST